MGAQAVRLSNVDINNALENKDFEVLFQPIFDLGNGGLARMETFVRWRHPSLGVLPPGAFISFFESQGRMSELTRYVLAVALDSYANWRGPYAPGFSINLALTDLSDDAFAPHLVKALRDRDFPADLVTLECPMPPVDADFDAAIANFERLRKTGARLAIEVRGRANEFLRTIDPFPFDEIKTGGSSILRFARTVRGPGLSAISDLLDIANKANAVITAVGVEDQASLAALRGLGFTAAQGNHLAKVGNIKDFRPGRVNEVRELLELEPLDSDDLSALFRTQPPSPKSSPVTEADDEAPAPNLIERLNARAQQELDTTEQKTSEAETQDVQPDDKAAKELAYKEEVRERARKKAKALALAKRAKARDARKAAAIKRAKAKVAFAKENAPEETPSLEADDANQSEDKDLAFPPSAAPRDLQERLAQEFDAHAYGEDDIDAELSNEDGQFADNAPEDSIDGDEFSDGDIRDEKITDIQDASPKVDAAVVAEVRDKDDVIDRSVTDTAAPQVDFNDINLAGGGYTQSAEPRENSHGTPRHEAQLSLPIGNAKAHFQPGIRVSGTPATLGDSLLNVPDGFDATTSTEIPADLVIEPADDVAAVDVTPAEEHHPEDATPGDEIPQGTLFSGETDDVVQEYQTPAPRIRRKKNILSRHYKVMPTHFWPRPWVRAIRRRAAQRPSTNQEG